MPASKLDWLVSIGQGRAAMGDRISRREALTRVGVTGAVLGAAAVTTRLVWDPGGFELSQAQGQRQVRSFEAKELAEKPVMAIAKSSKNAEELVKRAIAALGGMKRFVSNGDIVAIKPNIGWDRMPVHAANTNPAVV